MIYNGSTKIIKMDNDNAAYDNSKKVYQYYKPEEQEKDWSKECFTIEFTNIPDGETKFYVGTGTPVPLECSLDGGDTWEQWNGDFGMTVHQGDKVMLRCEDQLAAGEKGSIIYFDDNATEYKAYGNIMSLIYGEGFDGMLDLRSYNFTSMFASTNITDASNLILPATTLAENCYDGMFSGCTSLTTAPELPATTLAQSCYNKMFRDCSSLTEAPALPATTLAEGCYYQMFTYCTSLTTAPELLATTLVNSCYGYMFRGCTSLNYIKMLATDVTATSCLHNWVRGVSATGTFIKHPDADLLSGDYGIPAGWTVETATE